MPVLAEAQANGLSWLSDGERSRVDAMGSRARRDQFIAGHWLARCHAADVVGGEPKHWHLTAVDDGGLSLCSAKVAEGARLHASLSHSGLWLAAAIAPFPVGVDVECARNDRNIAALLDYCFSAHDCDGVRRMPGREQHAAFYRLWTLCEAQGKRDGHGLRPELTRRQYLLCSEPENAEAVSWQLGFAGLAVAGETAMRVHLTGIFGKVEPAFWRFVPAGA